MIANVIQSKIRCTLLHFRHQRNNSTNSKTILIWEDGERKKKTQKLTTQTVAILHWKRCKRWNYQRRLYIRISNGWSVSNWNSIFEKNRIQPSISIDYYLMISISFISWYFFELFSFTKECVFSLGSVKLALTELETWSETKIRFSIRIRIRNDCEIVNDL